MALKIVRRPVTLLILNNREWFSDDGALAEQIFLFSFIFICKNKQNKKI